MNNNYRPHIRVSRAEDAAAERHVFVDLTGELAIAICAHVALTRELGPDDSTVPICPLCDLFLAVDLDVDLTTLDREGRGR